jgi:hypothetical protein
MKTALLLLSLCLGTQSFQTLTEWYRYETAEASIDFPAKPEIASQEVPSAAGPIELKIASYEAAGENMAYVFITMQYPDSVIHSGKTAELPSFFRRSIEGAVANVNGKLLSERELRFKGFPGREAKVEVAQGQAVLLLRMYLVGSKGYFVQTISQPGKEESEEATRFHRSFQLKN